MEHKGGSKRDAKEKGKESKRKERKEKGRK